MFCFSFRIYTGIKILKFIFESLEVVFGESATTCSLSFPDILNGTWYYNYVCGSVDYNLFDITDGVNFMPAALGSRGEVALALYRLYQAGAL